MSRAKQKLALEEKKKRLKSQGQDLDIVDKVRLQSLTQKTKKASSRSQ
jgi:hypothetical protein